MSEVTSLQKLLKTSESVKSSQQDSQYAAAKTKQLLAANKAAASTILLRLQAELDSCMDSQVSSVEIARTRISYDK